MTHLRAILFDADGVIQQASYERFLATARRVLGDGRDVVDGFLEAVFAAEQPCLVGEADFPAVLEGVLAEWTCSGTPADLATAWEALDVVPGALDMVALLRDEGYICALATNQHAYRRRYMSEVLGYGAAFDHEFYSCDLGYRKPDTRYFDCIVERLGLAPAAIGFIDDSRPNVEAARSVGLRAVLHEGGDLRETVDLLRGG